MVPAAVPLCRFKPFQTLRHQTAVCPHKSSSVRVCSINSLRSFTPSCSAWRRRGTRVERPITFHFSAERGNETAAPRSGNSLVRGDHFSNWLRNQTPNVSVSVTPSPPPTLLTLFFSRSTLCACQTPFAGFKRRIYSRKPWWIYMYLGGKKQIFSASCHQPHNDVVIKTGNGTRHQLAA